jgi:hypothetical protein
MALWVFDLSTKEGDEVELTMKEVEGEETALKAERRMRCLLIDVSFRPID